MKISTQKKMRTPKKSKVLFAHGSESIIKEEEPNVCANGVFVVNGSDYYCSITGAIAHLTYQRCGHNGFFIRDKRLAREMDEAIRMVAEEVEGKEEYGWTESSKYFPHNILIG